MKIALYGASGMIGSRIAAEAVLRHHEVTGLTRTGSVQPSRRPTRSRHSSLNTSPASTSLIG